MNTVRNFQTDKIRTAFQRQTGSNWGRCCDCRDGSSKKEQHRGEKFFRPMDLYRNHVVLKDGTGPAVKAETKDAEKRIVSAEESVMQKNQAASAKKCSFQLCVHIGARHCTNTAKHRGALYVYVLIVMLVITTLSAITAILFDGNLGNASMQRDNLQLYYYSKAGADWAVGLLQSSAAELGTDSPSTEKKTLKEKLSAGAYNAKWTGKGDLKAKGEVKGRFSVTVEKVTKRVNSEGQFVSSGGTEVDYAKITSVGTSLSQEAGGTLKEGDKKYIMTVLVSLTTPDNVIYMPGHDK